jgi:hypothetical protein
MHSNGFADKDFCGKDVLGNLPDFGLHTPDKNWIKAKAG